MKTITIGLYLTKSGKEAIRVTQTIIKGKPCYSWIGSYGAGCGQTLEEYKLMVEDFKRDRRGLQTKIDINAFKQDQ